MVIDLVSPTVAVVCVLMALGTVAVLPKRSSIPVSQDRYASLDGLRGYLALFVFLHHSGIYYHYLRGGGWQSSALYQGFGYCSVALFFMITAFLFVSKVLDARAGGRAIDWTSLFVSRILRLFPLYAVAVVALCVTALLMSGGRLNESSVRLVAEVIRWMSFTILGGPNINRVTDTGVILAGVTWTLPYEWFFYLSLPLLALLIRVTPPLRIVAAALVMLAAILLTWRPHAIQLTPFLGGIAAAFLVRSARIRQLATRSVSTGLCLASLALSFGFIQQGNARMSLVFLTVVFCVVACGNSLGGLLTDPVSRRLGEVSYSIYLLHGLVLFWVFRGFIGWRAAAALSVTEHWCLVAILSSVVVLIASMTFRWIEAPAMRSVRPATQWIRSTAARVYSRG